MRADKTSDTMINALRLLTCEILKQKVKLKSWSNFLNKKLLRVLAITALYVFFIFWSLTVTFLSKIVQ